MEVLFWWYGKERGRFRMPRVPLSQDLTGCRNGRTRPAKGGEERRMNGWGEVRIIMDGERQGMRDAVSLREAGAI